jgi:hypothetical protein
MMNFDRLIDPVPASTSTRRRDRALWATEQADRLLDGVSTTGLDLVGIASDLEGLVDGLAAGVTPLWIRQRSLCLRTGRLDEADRPLLARQLRHTAERDHSFARERLKDLMAALLLRAHDDTPGECDYQALRTTRQALAGIRRISPSVGRELAQGFLALYGEVRADLVGGHGLGPDVLPQDPPWSLQALLAGEPFGS